MAQFLLVLSFLATLVLTGCSQEEPQTLSVRPVMVMQPLPASTIIEAFAGEVRARLEPELAFRIGGKVIARKVETGSRVKAGQILAELDPEDVGLHLQAMQAQVAAAQANLELVRAERDRYQQLLDKQMVSRSHFDSAHNQFKNGQARLKQAQAELEAAKNQTQYAQLRAPYAGVITRANVEAGQVVAAGQTVFVLAVDGEREVSFSIPEHIIDRFVLGQPVEVELWSQPSQRLTGEIRELAPAADSRSRTYAARVALHNSVSAAELGQSARVYVNADALAQLAVPLSAVNAEHNQAYVWVVDLATQKTVRRYVQTGAYTQTTVPIISGLQADDWIVVAGVHLLQEGQQVRAVDRDNRPVSQARE
ncbi:MAG: efflux RND transporter periplasmic adaptor subunit [Thiopseudomonas sp.]|nr:efflux RND transporter periplasmic adaptor subunit [Thiopseudomonas sp.]MCK9465173.1 efflux RND transporter periplasmic adaptor subunit [Thiopseudomonas sp.]